MAADSSSTRAAVFLSYASQDTEAARRICDALRAAGIDVWFDQGELRGGDAWDHMIRQRIRDCALFIPIISANTAARPEGYFRLEWSLADQRSHMQARNRTFILPVCIDATPPTAEDVPESFARVQWTRLPDGAVTSQFTYRIAALLSGAAPAPAVPAPAAPAAPAAAAAAGKERRHRPYLAAAVAVAIALMIFRPWHSPPAHREAAASAPAAAVTPSVAVLPFADLSEHHDQEYFSDGLTEELIDTLARIPQLRVPARTSSFAFKGKAAPVGEIGKALRVAYLLEGSVRTSGTRMRIAAQLVRADDGFQVWSQTFDRDTHDVFQVQDEIARAVADQLRLSLLATEDTASQTSNLEAHNLYLQARYLLLRDRVEDLESAVQLLQRAVQLDPKYAAAWAQLAYTHIRRVANGLDTTGGGFEKASAASQRAIDLDPRLPQGYLTLATARLQYNLDFPGTAELLDKAAQIAPNDPLLWQDRGFLAMSVGSVTAAVKDFQRASESDPLNLLIRKYWCRALLYAGQYQEAAAILRAGISSDPLYPGLHYELGRVLLQQHDPQAALAAFDAEPKDSAWRLFGQPLGLHAAGRAREAQGALEELVRQSAGSEFQVAEAYGFMGNRDKAFAWLDKSIERHDPGILWLRWDPCFASLTADPRYAALLKRLKIPPEAESK